MTPHINAADGAFAKTVLMPGDPLRAKFIAETFLENAELVTSVRNVLGYTGTYKGKKVSVMASGMGQPSIGIYSYELFKFYGVENIIRIGSAGSYDAELELNDVFLCKEAFSESTFAEVMNGYKEHVLPGNPELNAIIAGKANELGIDLKMGRVHSSDVFYSNNTWQENREISQGACVEMESFALFTNARFLDKRATCMLTISDSFVNESHLSAEDRQKGFRTMMLLALESAIEM